METEKRALLAVALCLGLLLVWPMVMNKFQKPSSAAPTSSIGSADTTAPAAGASAGSAAAAPTAAPGSPAAAQPGAVAGAPSAPPVEQKTVVEMPGFYRTELTSYGGAITSYQLLDHKYFTRDMRRLELQDGRSSPIVERRQTDGPSELVAGYRPALLTRFTTGIELPKLPIYALEKNETWPDGSRNLVYALDTPAYRIEKSFIFAPNSYQVRAQVSVTNKRDTPINYHLEIGLEGFQDPTVQSGGMFSARVAQNEVMWARPGKVAKLDFQKLDRKALLDGKAKPDDLRGDVHFIAIGQQYFMFALGLPRGEKYGAKQARASVEENGELSIAAELAEHTLGPGETRSYPLTIYGGPKLPAQLDAVMLEGQSIGLGSALDYTWGLDFIARPMLWVMHQVYSLTHNWALAIVLLTLLVKLILLYPSHRSMVSMRAMGQLKPQIEALKEKCGEDKNRFNTEMMALYRKHNINPLGGCLPILLQMPIYVALYSMLGNLVELYRVPLFWISDLTAPDPYFVLPVVSSALMYLQTKVLGPASVDPQQKAMTSMMPVIFLVFTAFVPAGLTLYILTNTLLGMLQQAVINRGQAKPATTP